MVLHTIADLIVGESKRFALHTPQGVSGAGTTSHGREGGRDSGETMRRRS